MQQSQSFRLKISSKEKLKVTCKLSSLHPLPSSLLPSFSAVNKKFFFTVSFFCPVHSSENSYWLRFQYQQLPLTEHKELWLGLSLFGTSSNWLQNSYENTMQVHMQMWKYMSMYKQGVFVFMLQLWCADLERGMGTYTSHIF